MLLAGRPLLAYTAEAARASRRLTRTIVSTDSDEIATVAQTLGLEVPFLRPAHVAGDETPMIDVLVDLVETLERREGYRPDVLVLLQPTSPFRRAEHIDAAVDLLVGSGADSVVSVVPVPHRFTPSSLMQLVGERLVPWQTSGAGVGPHQDVAAGISRPEGPMRRQDKPLLYARNGPAVVAVRTPVVAVQRTLYGSDTRPLVMPREASIDIDDPFDLELAERLMPPRPA